MLVVIFISAATEESVISDIEKYLHCELCRISDVNIAIIKWMEKREG